MKTFDLPSGAVSLAFHPSAEGVLAVGGKKGWFFLLDVISGEVKKSFQINNGTIGAITGMDWNKDGSLIRIVSSEGYVLSFDPRKQEKCDKDDFESINKGKLNFQPRTIQHLTGFFYFFYFVCVCTIKIKKK